MGLISKSLNGMNDEMSMASELPDYDELNEAMQRVEIAMESSECHGMLCALICADKQAKKHWLEEILPNGRESGDVLIQELATVFDAMYEITKQQFDAAEFGMRMLLPDDNEALPIRLQALGQWCEGFYLGLGIAGLSDLDKLPEDSREIVSDMVDIAQVEVDAEQISEEDEVAFNEVAEYLRVGVLLIHEELAAPKLATKH